jgi:hypothetical protein
MTKRAIAPDFLINTRAAKARCSAAATWSLAGLLPELRALIWDTLDWQERGRVGRTCRRLRLELRKHSVYIPNSWYPKDRHYGDANVRQMWRTLVIEAKINGLDTTPYSKLKCHVLTMNLLHWQHARLMWGVVDSFGNEWYLTIEAYEGSDVPPDKRGLTIVPHMYLKHNPLEAVEQPFDSVMDQLHSNSRHGVRSII